MKIILGPFLLLFLSCSLHNGGECEAGSITVPIIAHSKNVTSQGITSDDDFDQEEIMSSDKNLTSSSQDPIVVDDDMSKVVVHSEPCPISHSPQGGDDKAGGDPIHNHGNEPNSKLPSPTSLVVRNAIKTVYKYRERFDFNLLSLGDYLQ